MQPHPNGRPTSDRAIGFLPRLRVATLEARGVITGITNCGEAGLLPPDGLRELNDFYVHRVEPQLEAASVLERSARTIRSLVSAIEYRVRDPSLILDDAGL